MERTFYGKRASFLIKHTSGETHLQFCLREQPRHSDPILSSPHDTTAHCQVVICPCGETVLNLLCAHSHSWALGTAASPGIDFVNGT